jgi:hypothetical protein
MSGSPTCPSEDFEMNEARYHSARERVRAYATELLSERIRIGGAACGDVLALNRLMTGRKPLPGLHTQLARGVCAYALAGGDSADELAQITFLRDGEYVRLWSEGEYLLQCIGDYQRWKAAKSKL